jgi:putative component of toxin-antitoxin plasmid stabilization module
MPLPWPFPYYNPLGDGVGEIRLDLVNVEHRLYGFFGIRPDEFTVLIASSDKKRQQRRIQEAKKLKKQMNKSPFKTEVYSV